MKRGNSIMTDGCPRMRPPLIESESTLAFPPAFTIASPSTDSGEAMVKVGGRTLLSSRSRAPFYRFKALTDSAEEPYFLRRTESLYHGFEIFKSHLDAEIVEGMQKRELSRSFTHFKQCGPQCETDFRITLTK